MREILFRAKRLSDGVWVEGDLSRCVVVGETHIRRIEENLSTTTHKVYAETVCQYTGLTDKNGRKIFEGDILRFVNYINNNEWLCSIEFLEGSFICRYIYEDGELGEYNHFTSWHEKVKWEVIGNIFDNPELIGDQP